MKQFFTSTKGKGYLLKLDEGFKSYENLDLQKITRNLKMAAFQEIRGK